MNQRKAILVADGVITPNLADVNLIVLAEAPGHVNHACRHVQVERHAQPAVVRPLGERL